MRTIWKSIRRNPVINAFVLALAGQVAHDYLANQIDWTNIVGYFSLVFIGVAAREFTVPENEHDILRARLEAALEMAKGDFARGVERGLSGD